MSEALAPVQQRARGWALRITSWLMRALGTVAAGAAIQAPRTGSLLSDSPEPSTALMFAGLGVAGAALFVASLPVGRRARQHLVRTVGSADELAPGSYVLYLRPFRQDAGGAVIAPAVGADPLDSVTLRSGRTYEERLAKLFREFGPTVTVGRPGEELPGGSGAWRLYLPRDDWQDVVRTLIDKARLVILGAGPGQGTVWEYVELLRRGDPPRVVILVTSPDQYERFKAAGRAAAAAALPELGRRYGDGWSPPALPRLPNPARPRLTTRFYFLAMIYFRDRAWAPDLAYFDKTVFRGSTQREVNRFYKRRMGPMLTHLRKATAAGTELRGLVAAVAAG